MLPTDRRLYQVSAQWADTARLLTRLMRQGASLGHRERQLVRLAAADCEMVLAALTGASHEPAAEQVAAVLLEVVQQIYSRPLLLEHLDRAGGYLGLLARAEPGCETVALNKAQLAWLEEFLSECCLVLLRDLASRSMSPHAYAVGT